MRNIVQLNNGLMKNCDMRYLSKDKTYLNAVCTYVKSPFSPLIMFSDVAVVPDHVLILSLRVIIG